MQSPVTTVKSAVYVKSKIFYRHLIQVVLGSVFLALISLAKVPLYPTPMTLQTLGVFMLGFALGPKRGALAVALYLLEASCGWPVLSGGSSNPLWIISPNGGFLLSFVPAAFIVGFLIQKFSKKTFFTALLSVVCAQLCIYTVGVLGLSCCFGIKQAVMVGIVPFLSTMVIKSLLAATTYTPMEWIKKKVSKDNVAEDAVSVDESH